MAAIGRRGNLERATAAPVLHGNLRRVMTGRREYSKRAMGKHRENPEQATTGRRAHLQHVVDVLGRRGNLERATNGRRRTLERLKAGRRGNLQRAMARSREYLQHARTGGREKQRDFLPSRKSGSRLHRRRPWLFVRVFIFTNFRLTRYWVKMEAVEDVKSKLLRAHRKMEEMEDVEKLLFKYYMASGKWKMSRVR